MHSPIYPFFAIPLRTGKKLLSPDPYILFYVLIEGTEIAKMSHASVVI